MWLSRCEWPTAKRERQLWSCTGPWVTLVCQESELDQRYVQQTKLPCQPTNTCVFIFFWYFLNGTMNTQIDQHQHRPRDHPRSGNQQPAVPWCNHSQYHRHISSCHPQQPTNAPMFRPRTWLSSSEKCSSRDLRRNGNGSFACWGHRDDDQPWTFQDLVVQNADRICSNTRPERKGDLMGKKRGGTLFDPLIKIVVL